MKRNRHQAGSEVAASCLILFAINVGGRSLESISHLATKDLASLLLPKRELAVYSTPFKRSIQTAQPTAYGHGLKVQTYDPADPKTLASSILRQYKGGPVLVVGHSNTVLELVEAFGIKRPIPALGEEDYDYVFAITIQGNSL